jgi:hypothetical protein
MRFKILLFLALFSFSSLEAYAIETKWVGTAPVCKGKKEDCKGDWRYIAKGMHGMKNADDFGANGCVWGDKVLCAKVSNIYRYQWTACRPNSKKDCTDKGGVIFGYDGAGDGGKCMIGYKILCGFKYETVTKKFPQKEEYCDGGDACDRACNGYTRKENWKITFPSYNCKWGIPKDALADYKITFKNNKPFYINRNAEFTSNGKETLYVIDSSGSLYFVNVGGDIKRTIMDGAAKDRYTTHAGILTSNVIGDAQLQNQDVEEVVIGAGTVKYDNNKKLITEITNGSGHFKPSETNLHNSWLYLDKERVPSAYCKKSKSGDGNYFTIQLNCKK